MAEIPARRLIRRRTHTPGLRTVRPQVDLVADGDAIFQGLPLVAPPRRPLGRKATIRQTSLDAAGVTRNPDAPVKGNRLPCVGIGIPTRGRPAYLREALASVMAQTYSNWRLTISEDGPRSVPVLDQLEPYQDDPRITYVSTENAVGPARNMTSLISTGTEPYVVLLHDDDRWAPTFLEHHVAFLCAHPECGFVFSPFRTIDSQGAPIENCRFELEERVYNPEELLPKLLHRNMVSRPLVRRTAYVAVGMAFDERFDRIYDYDMYIRLAARFPAGYLHVHEYEYRIHGAQSSFVRQRRAEEHLLLIDNAEGVLSTSEINLSEQDRRQIRSSALIPAALDALEAGDMRLARRRLFEAVRLTPSVVFDPRVMAGLAATGFGDAGRLAICSVRDRRFKR